MGLPKYTHENQQERIGVHKVGLLLTELGLIFREISNTDVGIDGQIEYVNNAGEATGRIVAVQIKSGDSYLHESKKDIEYWTFYPYKKHMHYWEKYPIPVILLVHYPTNNTVYFIDVRHYLRIYGGISNIKIPKSNVLNAENKSKIYETIGEVDEPFFDIQDLFNQMIRKRCDNPTFNISFLDLFLQGLTNLCTQLYFDIDIAIDIAECINPYESISVGGREQEFLYEYIKFVVNQNLAEVDFGNCLIEWDEKKLVPRFLAPLTNRGNFFLEYINNIEADFSMIMPETTLVQERYIRLIFDNYSYNRIVKSQKIQNIILK